MAANDGRGGADQQDAFGLGGQARRERAVVAIFVFAAKDDPERSGKGVNGFFGGVDIGGF